MNMNTKMLMRVLYPLLMLEAVFLIPAYGISSMQNETVAMHAILQSIEILALFAFVFFLFGRKEDIHKLESMHEGLAITGICWVAVCMFGSLPFYISKEIPSYVDAVFEMVSGFTTTGATILFEVEHLSKGLLYWRSFSHWIGGMGVLIFLTALMPAGKSSLNNTFSTLQASSPQPPSTKLMPRIKLTSSILLWTYVILTVLDFLCLWLGGMPIFDALCVAYSTSGTGGFGIKNTSMSSYSPFIQTITTVFMLLFGINFSCYYLLFVKRAKEVVKDEELRWYFRIVILSTILIFLNLTGIYKDILTTLRYAFFQVGSIITTTGFAIVDYNTWPIFSKTIILFLMFSGACAGSTGGGIKVARILMLGKSLQRSFAHGLENDDEPIVVNGNQVDEKVMINCYKYLLAYVSIVMISVIVISFDNFDMETNISAVLATFNNIGPGFGKVGPSGTYGIYGTVSKIVLIIDMLAGRLEIYPIMILLSPRVWKKELPIVPVVKTVDHVKERISKL